MPNHEDQATLQAYATGVDQAARAADDKWGMGRLALIVSDDTRAKFLRQQAKWYAAHEAAWAAPMMTRAMLDDVTAKCAAMRRAWAAMDAEAMRAGHAPTDPEVWETVRADGVVIAIVRDTAAASKVIASGRYLSVYTVGEIANVLAALPEAMQAAKATWPGSKIVSTVPPIGRYGDPLPF